MCSRWFMLLRNRAPSGRNWLRQAQRAYSSALCAVPVHDNQELLTAVATGSAVALDVRDDAAVRAAGITPVVAKHEFAAGAMADTPAALQLRLLQTIVEVASERNSTLVLPFPVELLRFLEGNTPGAARDGSTHAEALADTIAATLRRREGAPDDAAPGAPATPSTPATSPTDTPTGPDA